MWEAHQEAQIILSGKACLPPPIRNKQGALHSCFVQILLYTGSGAPSPAIWQGCFNGTILLGHSPPISALWNHLFRGFQECSALKVMQHDSLPVVVEGWGEWIITMCVLGPQHHPPGPGGDPLEGFPHGPWRWYCAIGWARAFCALRSPRACQKQEMHNANSFNLMLSVESFAWKDIILPCPVFFLTSSLFSLLSSYIFILALHC